jgi:putative spermidine/putrescine transport system permease protein
LPRTLAALRDWDGRAVPDDAAFAALAQDLRAARDTPAFAPAAARLNLDIAGLRTLLARTAQAAPPTKAALLKFDPAWGNIETWGAIRRARGRWTDFNLLAALDLKRDAAGAIRSEPPEQIVFRTVLLRTFAISALVTLLCLLLGYPVAALLALLPARTAALLAIAVLLPFWTGVIVRSAAWMALLGHDGPVAALIGLATAAPPLLFTRFAVILAMTHIQLPFMILPLLVVMRRIPRLHWRAAASLGAAPAAIVARIWLPQTAPGIAAGALLVFLPCLGFFVTPALLGGGADQMLAFLIGDAATHAGNWPLAAALSVVLLAATLLLALVAARPVRFVLARSA